MQKYMHGYKEIDQKFSRVWKTSEATRKRYSWKVRTGVEYFNFIGKGLGFNVVKGCCLNSLEHMTEKEQKYFDRIIEKQSKKYYSTLIQQRFPIPTFFRIMIFRMARTSMKLMLDNSWRDYQYYMTNGLFKSEYYYPTQLNPMKKWAGNFFDFIFTCIYKKKSLKST